MKIDKLIDKLKNILFIPNYIERLLNLNIIPDKLYLSVEYRIRVGKKLNWYNLIGFNEKLQWLKLYNRKPEYTTYVDKYAVREYIAKTIGKEYLIPLIGVWDSPEEIDFDKLPNQFVIKCNHDSGGLSICKDKSNFNLNAAIKRLNHCLNNNYYLEHREWPYKNVPRKIIAEKYMVDDSNPDGDLKDYKFMCFNGKVECSFVCSDRFSKEGLHVTFFDLDWNVLPFERHYPSRKEGLPKPICYDEMITLAEKLSKDIPFVRVDFYEVNGKVYFGELTFFPGSGFEEFTPRSADEWLGSWITLPNNK